MTTPLACGRGRHLGTPGHRTCVPFMSPLLGLLYPVFGGLVQPSRAVHRLSLCSPVLAQAAAVRRETVPQTSARETAPKDRCPLPTSSLVRRSGAAHGSLPRQCGAGEALVLTNHTMLYTAYGLPLSCTRACLQTITITVLRL